MPHKKAKRTVREKLRNETGTDLAPGKDSLQNEAIPKSAARIFNSQAIRDEYKLKKRKMEAEGERPGKKQKTGQGNGEKSVTLKIQPGESIQHFNRRVEDDLRPLVKTAVQTSRAVARSAVKAEQEARNEAKKGKQTKNKPKDAKEPDTKAREVSPPLETDKFKDRPKEFRAVSTSAPKRLNDIAQAPPELKKVPRGAGSAIGKRDGVLSMAQKVMMEQEREKAIARYRELKASRRQTGDTGDKAESKDE